VEQYSLNLMPSLSLTNVTRENIRNATVLAMGAQTFAQQTPLPAASVEIQEIAKNLWPGQIYLDQSFTVQNLRDALASQRYRIVHLATHGEFQSSRRNSFVVFSDRNLTLDEFAQLGLDQPIDLLTLSACKTAFGDFNAELGFAGLAVKTGVRSAIGSLWYVSDSGTLALMTSFYDRLRQAPIKAEALRQAQLSLLRGTVQITENQLTLESGQVISLQSLPASVRQEFVQKDLRHPYYWSAFTLIGNPW
jgi:CHAT domain-containing protein